MTQGIILCGGIGSRLFPITTKLPKCLIYVGQNPMMYYPLLFLDACNVDYITVVARDTFIKEIIDYTENADLVPPINYCIQHSGNTVGAGLSVVSHVEHKNIVIFCDLILEYPFDPGLIDMFWSEDKAICPNVVVTTHMDDVTPYGAVVYNDDLCAYTFAEKKLSGPGDISLGVFSVDYDRMKHLCYYNNVFEYFMFNDSAGATNSVNCKRYKYTGRWVDAGTIEGLTKAVDIVKGYPL